MANPRRRGGGFLFGGAGGRRPFCYFSMLFEEGDSCSCMCLMFIGSTSACRSQEDLFHLPLSCDDLRWLDDVVTTEDSTLCADKFWDATFNEEKNFVIKAHAQNRSCGRIQRESHVSISFYLSIDIQNDVSIMLLSMEWLFKPRLYMYS